MAVNMLPLLVMAGGAALLLGGKKKKKNGLTTDPTVTTEELEPDVPSPTGFEWAPTLKRLGDQFGTTFTRLHSGIQTVSGREREWTVVSADPPTSQGAYAGIYQFTDTKDGGVRWANDVVEAKTKLGV